MGDPWGGPGVRSLLSGKMELQQQVLELVSAEGVDLVLLRVGRDKNTIALLAALSFFYVVDPDPHRSTLHFSLAGSGSSRKKMTQKNVVEI